MRNFSYSTICNHHLENFSVLCILMENFRKTGPLIKDIENVFLPSYSTTKLDNGLPVYLISSGTQDIIKIELVFQAGRAHEVKKVVSRACNNQLKEGCATFSSQGLADKIDFFGATFRTSENLDTCSLLLFCMGKHFERLMPILRDIVVSPLFPEDELRKYINNNSERLKVELVKNDVVAYRSITEKIFTDIHPYGYNSGIDDYAVLERQDLVSHYDSNYGYNNCHIFLSGKVDESHVEICNRYLGAGFKAAAPQERVPDIEVAIPQTIHTESDKEFQTAIKIGRKLFARSHKDYPGMYFLNAVLGGYFGSRLMSNIREDKGFTYNIYSEVDVMKHGGLFMIGTEVGDEYVEKTQHEISKELKILRNELISAEELKMVRNYLLGRILNFVDGPFNAARLLKSIIQSNLDKDYFDHLIHTIKTISAEELRNLAQKYLKEEDMWNISVGK